MRYQKKTYIKTCIACIAVDSVMKMEKKKNYLQAYLKESKSRTKKTNTSNFINIDSESELSKFINTLLRVRVRI